MQEENANLRHAEEIAAEVWWEMGRTNLADPAKLGAIPRIQFKPGSEMGEMNGLAWHDHIDLNADRLEDSDAEAFLQEVIRHELAHVAEFRLTGIMGHGPLWHALCLAVGGTGKASGSFHNPLEFFMIPAVFGSAVLFSLGISALHAPLWCAITGIFIGFLFPPVCWALFCKKANSVYSSALIFTIAEGVILLAVLFL